jgi:hypothetical protein
MQFLIILLLIAPDIIKLIFGKSPMCPLCRIPVVGCHVGCWMLDVLTIKQVYFLQGGVGRLLRLGMMSLIRWQTATWMIVSVCLTTSIDVNQRSGVRSRRYTETKIAVLTIRLKHLLA